MTAITEPKRQPQLIIGMQPDLEGDTDVPSLRGTFAQEENEVSGAFASILRRCILRTAHFATSRCSRKAIHACYTVNTQYIQRL